MKWFPPVAIKNAHQGYRQISLFSDDLLFITYYCLCSRHRWEGMEETADLIAASACHEAILFPKQYETFA
jgi:hypothetical protein